MSASSLSRVQAFVRHLSRHAGPKGFHRLLELVCLLCLLCLILPLRAQPSEPEGPEVLPPDLVSPSDTFPREAALALDDRDLARASTLIEAALRQHPTDVGLRFLRQLLLAAGEPEEVLARPVLSGEGADPADRLEACFSQLLRLQLERATYRGDKTEGAEAFIARQTASLDGLEKAVSGLEQTSVDPLWQALARTWVHKLQNGLTLAEQKSLWLLSGEAGSWSVYLRLWAVERGLVDEDEAEAWLQAEGPAALKADRPLGPKQLLVWMQLVRGSLDKDRWLRWLEVTDREIKPGPYRDDFDLLYGKALSQAYGRRQRELGVVRLLPLTERVLENGEVAGPGAGRLRNTTLEAAEEVGALLRRLSRYEEAVQFYQAFAARYGAPRGTLSRDLGRALYQLGRYPEAVAAFRQATQGPRGLGKDYRFVAETLRFLPEAQQSASWPTLRAEALTLVDFATDATNRETRVKGWIEGEAPQLTSLKVLLQEGMGLSSHALLLPLTFLSLGVLGLLEALALALGLIGLATWPRVSRKAWPLALGLSVAVALLGGSSLLLPWKTHPGWLVGVIWMVQAAGRSFFLLAGATALSPGAGLVGLRLVRRLARGGRRLGRFRRLQQLGPVLLGGVVVAGLEWVARGQGLTPVPYLERFPALLTGSELGVYGTAAGVGAGLLLSLYAAAHGELLARGLLLTWVAWLLGRGPVRRWVSVGGVAVVWALCLAGVREPPPVQLGLLVAQGVVLGGVRLSRGIDGALVSGLLAVLLGAAV